MANKQKKSETVAEETAKRTESVNVEAQIPDSVKKLMKLYSQYEKIWVTPDGFVHPQTAPSYLIKGATLYDNLFYNK